MQKKLLFRSLQYTIKLIKQKFRNIEKPTFKKTS